MHPRTLMSLENFNRYWKNTPMAEVAKRINYSKPA
jgi:hypothetical protein